MAEQQKVYKYHFCVGQEIVETGIASDLNQREDELMGDYEGFHSYIMQVGFGPVTRTEAEQWLAAMRKADWPVNKKMLNGA